MEKELKEYRVDGYDSFDKNEYPIASFDTLEEAEACAKKHGGTMNLTYVHDSKGNRLSRYGSY